MNIFGVAGFLLFGVILPAVLLAVVGLCVRNRLREMAEDRASISQIQAPEEKAWLPKPERPPL